MKRLIKLFNVMIVVVVIFFGINHLHAMNEQTNKECTSLQEREIYKAQSAEEYNLSHPLFLLPKEMLHHITVSCFSQKKDQVESLIDSMKNLIKLSMVCKKYNTLLTHEIIGSYCKNYAPEDKDEALKTIMIDTDSYADIVPLSILIHAGTDPNIKIVGDPLLCHAVIRKDEHLVRLLFQYNANPNVKYLSRPVFFEVKTMTILKLFLAQKNFNVHAVDDNGINVLWYIVRSDEYSADLIKVLLASGIDAKQIMALNNSCLLHRIARRYGSLYCITGFLQKAKLIVDVIPQMINMLDHKGKTPLDIARESSIEARWHGFRTDIARFEKLIELYVQYGALTSEQLKQQVILQRQIAQKNEVKNIF